MTTELRNTELGRTLYNQLRLSLAFPGEAIAETRKVYRPVNKDNWTFDFAMTQPDTPAVAQGRRYEKTMWLMIGAA